MSTKKPLFKKVGKTCASLYLRMLNRRQKRQLKGYLRQLNSLDATVQGDRLAEEKLRQMKANITEALRLVEEGSSNIEADVMELQRKLRKTNNIKL